MKLRITSQQEEGCSVTCDNTNALFKQSFTHPGWGFTGSKANNNEAHNHVSLFTALSVHIWEEKGTDKAGLTPDNRLDLAVQTAISPVVLTRFRRMGVRRMTHKEKTRN